MFVYSLQQYWTGGELNWPVLPTLLPAPWSPPVYKSSALATGKRASTCCSQTWRDSGCLGWRWWWRRRRWWRRRWTTSRWWSWLCWSGLAPGCPTSCSCRPASNQCHPPQLRPGFCIFEGRKHISKSKSGSAAIRTSNLEELNVRKITSASTLRVLWSLPLHRPPETSAPETFETLVDLLYLSFGFFLQ